jgi:hypothetical protein
VWRLTGKLEVVEEVVSLVMVLVEVER